MTVEQIRLIDMCCAFRELSQIKKPSKRVKDVIANLEDRICRKIETMQDWYYAPPQDRKIG